MRGRRGGSAEAETAVPALAFMNCPAKTYEDAQGQLRFGRSVFEHCLIVGSVARALLQRMPESLRLELFPSGCALLAAAHDVGKISPTFVLKLLKAIANTESTWQEQLKKWQGTDEHQWGGHPGASAVALEAITPKAYIAAVAGQHHGFTPNIGLLNASSEVLGGKAWQEQRALLVEALQQALQEEWPDITSAEQALLLAGLTTVADWIGSGELFEDPSEPWQPKIEVALDRAGFIPPTIKKGLQFGDLFQDQDGTPFTPSETQIKLHEQCQGSGVYVLEAPMGLGKTEAALYAAYQLLEQGEAQGIYFALPTQLTSNKIYDRFNSYLKAILADDSPHKQSLLLHGNAWLIDHELGEEGKPGGSWFNSSKRGLLAPFAVGTLDQALMAAMNVKHGFVRTFGLAGKVVILDEVHSYDAYTSVILDELIKLLRQLHCTVIILSATLSGARRQQLLGQKGEQQIEQAYPLITTSKGDDQEKPSYSLITPPENQHVAIKLVAMENQPAIEEALQRAEQGQQVLWIENTVREAQELYFALAARCQDLGMGCGLLHSRFTQDHRQQNETLWVTRYGKAGWSDRTQQGRILIGTQVLEQSLDIDADFLLTRIAPTDMLLQRLGRLWRHSGTPRPEKAKREAWILAPKLSLAQQQPQREFGSTAAVYAPYVLCRTLEVWTKLTETSALVGLPNDIRQLVEETYRERVEMGNMAQWLHELQEGTHYRKGLKTLQQFARLTLSKGGTTLPESKAQTRYSEQETAEVLLLQALDLDAVNKQTCLTLLDGKEINIPWQRSRLTKPQWRKLAALLMQQMVACRREQLPRQPARDWCEKIGLGNLLYLGHPEADEAGIALALITPTYELKTADGQSISDRYRYQYRADIGLQITKIKE